MIALLLMVFVLIAFGGPIVYFSYVDSKNNVETKIYKFVLQHLEKAVRVEDSMDIHGWACYEIPDPHLYILITGKHSIYIGPNRDTIQGNGIYLHGKLAREIEKVLPIEDRYSWVDEISK